MKLDLSRLDPASQKRKDEWDLGLGIVLTPGFELPPIQERSEFLKSTLEVLKPMHGTTTLGFVCKIGVIIAVDSRATMGNFIASQRVDKVLRINRHLLGTMAGGAADCQFWERNLSRQCRLHELENGRRISVAGASKLLANTLYSYRNSGLSIGTMIAGWDASGPRLFYVDSDGTRMEGNRFAVGSGATYAYGVLDQGFRSDIELEAAAELGRRAIYHATFRDAASGGTASVYHIGPEGWTKLSGNDVTDLHFRYYPAAGPVEQAGSQPAAADASMEEASG